MYENRLCVGLLPVPSTTNHALFVLEPDRGMIFNMVSESGGLEFESRPYIFRYA
jgi:hypothetical protein